MREEKTLEEIAERVANGLEKRAEKIRIDSVMMSSDITAIMKALVFIVRWVAEIEREKGTSENNGVGNDDG